MSPARCESPHLLLSRLRHCFVDNKELGRPNGIADVHLGVLEYVQSIEYVAALDAIADYSTVVVAETDGHPRGAGGTASIGVIATPVTHPPQHADCTDA